MVYPTPPQSTISISSDTVSEVTIEEGSVRPVIGLQRSPSIIGRSPRNSPLAARGSLANLNAVQEDTDTGNWFSLQPERLLWPDSRRQAGQTRDTMNNQDQVVPEITATNQNLELENHLNLGSHQQEETMQQTGNRFGNSANLDNTNS